MPKWPPIDEPELLRRLAMDDAEFAELIHGVIGQLGSRPCEADSIAQALGYPWARPDGSYLLVGDEVSDLGEMEPARREDVITRYATAASTRLPVLSIGSNAAPETLRRKFAHFEAAEDRTVLTLSGHLYDFDVGVAAQPTLYGSMPATLFPSPGTAVRTALLWVTPAQFTQLTWSEITYRLGRLRARFEVEEGGDSFAQVVLFASRFGVFCPDGEPVALAAIPARDRTAPALTQEELLTAAARLALGPEADAETLIRAIFASPGELIPKLAETVHRAAQPFAPEGWEPFAPASQEGSG